MTAGKPEGQTSGPPTEADVREDIERTRQQLGETAEALAAKADVKARARQKATQLKEQAATRAAQVKEQAATRASQVKEQAATRASQTRGQAASSWGDNPAALAAAVAAVVFTCIAIVLWRRR
jgi:ABC-type transporter Mla subunit MlaD